MTTASINGRYRTIRELGRGGMGMVYLVEDTERDDLPMALKTMIANHADEEFLDSFRKEFAELARIRHVNVAAAFDFGRIATSGEHFFTTEFVDGIDLFKATRRVGFEELLDVTTQLLRGLDFLHSHGLLHNDLKPANILLAKPEDQPLDARRGDLRKLESTVFGVAGCVKIIDFGLLSHVEVSWDKARGTPRYMSPERIQCETADARSDLYSLGCVLYLLASGRFPFEGKTTLELLSQHIENRAPRLDTVSRSTPPAFADFVHHLIRKDPARRPRSAAAALEELQQAFRPDSGARASSVGTPPVTVGSLRHRRVELAELSSACTQAFAGEGIHPCVVITGEAGVGKTRLVEELKAEVQTGGGAFVRLDADAVSGHLGPVAHELLAALRTSGAENLARVESEILGEDKGDEADDFAVRLERLIFHYARRTPLLILFDDFHEASETVRLFAVGLVEAACSAADLPATAPEVSRNRLLVVAARRSHGNKGDLQLDGARTVHLEPFTAPQSEDFLKRAFSQTDIPAAVLSRLSMASRGNARFLIELSRHLAEKKHVTHDGSRWQFPDTLEGIPLPDSLKAAVDARVDTLGTDATTVLQWLAAALAPISVRALERCTLLERERLSLTLKRLRRSGFVDLDKSTQDEPDTEEYWTLVYPDLRERFSSVDDEKRHRFVHQKLAQIAEEEGAVRVASSGERAEVVAAHWLESNNFPAFLRYAPEAAEHLRASGNFARAVEYHAQLAKALPDDAVARKIKSLVQLAEMHEFLWDLEQSSADLKAVLELGKDILKPADRVALNRRRASLALARVEPQKALRHIREVRRIQGESDSPAERLSLAALEAWARWLAGDTERATEQLARATIDLKQCDDVPPKQLPLVLGARNWLSMLRYHFGQVEEATAMQEGNLKLIDKLDHPQARASCLCTLGGMLLDLGQHREASELLSGALEIGKRIGDRRTLSRARERLGEYHLLHGSVQRALQLTQVGLQDAESLQGQHSTGDALRLLGRIYMRVGQLDDALGVLKRAVALQRDQQDVAGAAYSRIFLARVHITRGDTDAARRQLMRAEREAEARALRRILSLCQLVDAEAELVANGRVPSEVLLRCQQTIDGTGFRRELIDLGILRARSARGGGDFEVARHSLAAIDELLRTIGSEEQDMEVTWLDAVLDFDDGYVERALKKLLELRRIAKNTVFPALAQRCREELKAIKQAANA